MDIGLNLQMLDLYGLEPCPLGAIPSSIYPYRKPCEFGDCPSLAVSPFASPFHIPMFSICFSLHSNLRARH